MANEFVARKGLIVSGSTNISGSVTASFFKGDGSQLTNLPSTNVASSVINTNTFTGDGSQNTFTLSGQYIASSLMVSVDGLFYTPTTDFSVSGSNIIFVSPPPSSSDITVRAMVNIVSGGVGTYSGSFIGSLTGSATTASYASNAQLLNGTGSGTFATTGSNIFVGTQTISGSINFQSGSSISPNTQNLEIKPGVGGNLILFNNNSVHSITINDTNVTATDLTVTNGITGSLYGTSSWANKAISSSYTTTASYALNAGAGAGFPYSGSAVITGSLYVTGSTISGSFVGDGSGLTNIFLMLAVDKYKFVGDGSTYSYILSHSYYNNDSLLVSVGGISYIATEDYNLSGSTITFTEVPPSGSLIAIRSLMSTSSGPGGNFSGSLIGTASFATSASFATTASYASNVLKTKAGSIAYTAFGGTPYSASVTFSTAFPNTNFAVVITGEDARIWTIESKTASGFTVNSNSNTAVTGTAYWTCTAYGEN